MKSLLLALPLVLVAGCASKFGTTVPGETSHIAIGTGYTELESVEMATATAENYCKQDKKRHAVDQVQTEYKGVVTEETRENADTVAKVARAAGVFLPSLGSDDDYKTVATFRCL